MKLNRPLFIGTSAVFLAGLAAAFTGHSASRLMAIPAGSLASPKTGALKLASAGALAFGSDGLLLVAEPRQGVIVALQTGDHGPFQKLGHKVENVPALAAAGLGAAPENIVIADMAVNPASGRIYLSVTRKPDNAAALVTVDAAGKVAALDLNALQWQRVALPGGTSAKVTNITDLAVAANRVIVAGSCNEEFASKIFSIALPMADATEASVFSAETYHVSHRKWETKAPISSFIPYDEAGKHYIVGAFACTPVAKFALDDLQSGSQVKGVSMVELGSGNRPLDMFEYDKGGKHWLVVHTQRFHKPLFGPSEYWGARVDMALLKGDKTNENAVRRDTKQPKDPAGIEIVDALFGAVQVDKLGTDEAVVLRAGNGGGLGLEVVQLP